jgi:hypothetical protein
MGEKKCQNDAEKYHPHAFVDLTPIAGDAWIAPMMEMYRVLLLAAGCSLALAVTEVSPTGVTFGDGAVKLFHGTEGHLTAEVRDSSVDGHEIETLPCLIVVLSLCVCRHRG